MLSFYAGALPSGRLAAAAVCLLAALGAPGCGGGPEEIEVEGPSLPASREWLDVQYAEGSSAQRLDIYLPPTGDGPFPVVLWIHGGGWFGGTKRIQANRMERELNVLGYALVSPDYRLSGEATYPAAVHDLKAVVRWLRANATDRNLLADRIGVWGVSAGAHLGLMLATTAGVVELEGTLGNPNESSAVQAMVDWYGPSDLLLMDEHAQEQGCKPIGGTGYDHPTSPVGLFLGDAPSAVPDVAAEASPINWLSDDDPPFLVSHGLSDCTVPWRQSEALAEAISSEIGPSAVSLFLINAGHGGEGFQTQENFDRVADFFDTHVR